MTLIRRWLPHDIIAAELLNELPQDILSDFVKSGYTISAGTGLQAVVAAGVAYISDGSQRFRVEHDAQNTLSLTASSTNHIFLNQDGTFTVNTGGTPPSNSIKLGRAVTDASSVTATYDDRPLSLVGPESIRLNPRTSDVPAPVSGDLWCRSDTEKIRGKIGSTIRSLNPYLCFTGDLNLDGSKSVTIRYTLPEAAYKLHIHVWAEKYRTSVAGAASSTTGAGSAHKHGYSDVPSHSHGWTTAAPARGTQSAASGSQDAVIASAGVSSPETQTESAHTHAVNDAPFGITEDTLPAGVTATLDGNSVTPDNANPAVEGDKIFNDHGGGGYGKGSGDHSLIINSTQRGRLQWCIIAEI